MEKSPQPSPEKVYAPLQVVSPNQSEPSVYSIPPPTLVRPAQEGVEQEAVVDTHNPFETQECSVLPENPEENPEAGEQPHETQSATPPIASTSALQDTFPSQLMDSLAAAISSRTNSPDFHSTYLWINELTHLSATIYRWDKLLLWGTQTRFSKLLNLCRRSSILPHHQ